MKRNGFTLTETLLSLLILVLLTGLSTRMPNRHPLPLFMQTLEYQLITEQQTAFINKERRSIRIQETSMTTQEGTWNFPAAIACSPTAFHYNAKGNISSAGTIVCSSDDVSMKLVMQLGTGSLHIERIES